MSGAGQNMLLPTSLAPGARLWNCPWLELLLGRPETILTGYGAGLRKSETAAAASDSALAFAALAMSAEATASSSVTVFERKQPICTAVTVKKHAAQMMPPSSGGYNAHPFPAATNLSSQTACSGLSQSQWLDKISRARACEHSARKAPQLNHPT